MIWANLLHLSYNMWMDRDAEGFENNPIVARPYLRFDETLWNDLLHQMAQAQFNMVILDLGDAIQYQSHPEIAIENAWSPDKLRDELKKMRAMGLEPIPKLNFSTAHDAWMGPYSRMVSTPQYYQVVRDLIEEVAQLFDTPRFFHLGMDEEDAKHQTRFAYAAMRQHELWWHDLFLMISAVENSGSKAWVWSDYVWQHGEEFYRQMPKSVLQSNWYYGAKFDGFEDGDADKIAVQAYCDLQERGYDQVPTGSNWNHDSNMESTVDFCTTHLAPEQLKGFMTAPWHPTTEAYREHHTNAVTQLARSISRSETP